MIPKSVCLSHISFLNSTLINSITFFVFLHFFLNVLTIMGLFFLKSISHSPLFSSAHTGPDFCSLRTSEIPESWLPSGIKPWETHVERQTAGEKEGCNYSSRPGVTPHSSCISSMAPTPPTQAHCAASFHQQHLSSAPVMQVSSVPPSKR